MKNKKAFTLGEYLITLAIIGVVSMVTIPVMKESSRNKAYVTQVQKAFATLSNVTKLINNELGATRFWVPVSVSTNSDVEKIAEQYEKHMNIISPPDLADYVLKTASGNNSSDGNLLKNSRIIAGLDGMIYFFPVRQSTINLVSLFSIWVDTNGLALPNKIGYDVVKFEITPEGIIPDGLVGDEYLKCKKGASDTDNSTNCTARIIQEGKISW